jgi:phosphoribosylamine--glycine ligase
MEAEARRLDVAAEDVDGLVATVEREGVGLTVVGPEAPLVAGLVDALTERGHPAFGPTAAAARLEGSKAFAKEVMAAAGVPTAAWAQVRDVASAMAAIERYPVVLKADGLAAGKGVVIASDEAEARDALDALLVQRRFGGHSVVVEEFLEGEEVSLLAVCDGRRALPMAPAQDYKRIFDGDRGPNTGGMGSYSPVPGIGAEQVAEIVAGVHQPVVDLLRDRGTPFHGVLYAGLMMTADGPRVLEFNTRFGDPETQAILPRMRSDLLTVLDRATRLGGLDGIELTWTAEWAVTVVLASAGYPEGSSSGDPISGLETLDPALEVTHAGTAHASGTAGQSGAGLVTAGGRVLNVTALGADPAAARRAAYAGADMIDFPGRQLRRDIAQRAERTHR